LLQQKIIFDLKFIRTLPSSQSVPPSPKTRRQGWGGLDRGGGSAGEWRKLKLC